MLIGVAFLFDLASFQFKRRKYTLICFTCAASLVATHFFLLGAITAGAVVAVSATRFFVSIFTTDKRVKWLFVAVILVLGIYTFDGYEDVLITIAMLFSTFASFHINEKRLRQFMMLATVLVITHNIVILTPAGIALETFFLGSNLVSYWRFYIKKQKPRKVS